MERFTVCDDPNLDILIHKLNHIGLYTIIYQLETKMSNARNQDEMQQLKNYITNLKAHNLSTLIIVQDQYFKLEYFPKQQDQCDVKLIVSSIDELNKQQILQKSIQLDKSCIILNYKSDQTGKIYTMFLNPSRLQKPIKWQVLLKLDQIGMVVSGIQLNPVRFELTTNPPNVNNQTILSALFKLDTIPDLKRSLLKNVNIDLELLQIQKYNPLMIDRDSHQQLPNQQFDVIKDELRNNFNITFQKRLSLYEMQQFLFNILLHLNFDIQHHIQDMDIQVSTNTGKLTISIPQNDNQRISIESWIRNAIQQYFGPSVIINDMIIQKIMQLPDSQKVNGITFVSTKQN